MADLITAARAAFVPSLAGIAAPYLASLITAASNMVERYCKREFTQVLHTDELHDGDGTGVLWLKNFPVSALTSIKTVESDGTEETCLGAQFRVNLLTGEVRAIPECTCVYCYFPSGYRNIKATYTAGWAIIPEDIQEAVAQTVAWLYAKASSAATEAGWKLGVAARTYFKESSGDPMLPASVRQLLAFYRNIRP